MQSRLDRAAIERDLGEKRWFDVSPARVKDALLGLPDICLPFLSQLSLKPDTGGGLTIIRIQEVFVPKHPPFLIQVNFLVRDLKGGEFCHQATYWRFGKHAVAKGVIVVTEQGQPSTMLFVKTFSFACGEETICCTGGLVSEKDYRGTDKSPEDTLRRTFLRECEEETGIKEQLFSKIVSLGPFHPDHGITVSEAHLFAGFVAASALESAKQRTQLNADTHEPELSLFAVPLADLWGADGLLMRCKNSFVHSCVMRLLALGIIRQP